MNRRQLLSIIGGAAVVAAQQKPVDDSAVAGATVDTTPRVGIVLSSFRGSSDHDGAILAGLQDPQPASAVLTSAQLDGMLLKAIELGNQRGGGLETVVEPDDWVVIQPHIGLPGDPAGPHPRHLAGSASDPRLVRGVIAFLVGRGRGSRFTIAAGSGDWATTNWDGAYGGLSYRQMVRDFAAEHPKLRFDLVDLNLDECGEEQVRGKAAASRNPSKSYRIPKTITRCDRLICLAPMMTDARTGAALSIGNYFGIAPASVYGTSKDRLFQLGDPHEVLADLYSIRPPDYAVVGGSWGVEHDGARPRSVHHNLVVAGHNAVAVDAVAATAMGLEPKSLGFLRILDKKGLGTLDLDAIWMRGNDVGEAKRPFRKPAGTESVQGERA